MNKRIVCLAVALSTLSLVVTTSSSAQAARKSAKSSRPGFLGAFSKAHKNMLVAFDVVPHVRAALQSQAAVKLQALLQERMGEEVSTAEVLTEVNSMAPKLPAEVAMGLTDGGIADLGRIAHGVLLGMLASEAVGVEDNATLSRVHEALTRLLKKGGLDGLVLYARLHSEEMAKGVMGMVVSQARMMKETNEAMEFDISDDAVGVVVNMGRSLTKADVSGMFMDFGVVPGQEHPATSALVGAVRSIEQTLWFDRVGAGLRLTFGPRARRSRPLRAKKLGASYRATAADLLWSRWTAKPWAAVLKAVDASLSSYEDTAAWKALLKANPQAVTSFGISSFLTAYDKGTLGKQGDARLWAEGDALRGLAHVGGVKKATPVAKSSLARLMPGAATMIHADTVHSVEGTLRDLGELLTGQLGPLADAERVAALTERLEALFDKGAEEVFESGGAFLVGWGGDVDTLNIVRSEEDGTQKRLTGTRLPHYGMGLVFPLVTGADGLGFGAQALTLIGEVLCAVGGGTLDADARLTRPTKLGLGNPTLAVPWESMTACRVGKASTQVEVSGDLLLHTFQLGDALVLSTSRALSVRIASTYAGAHGAYRLPKPKTRGKLVGFGDFDGAALGAWIGSFGTWIERIEWGDGDDGAEARGEVVGTIHSVADTLRLIDEISWTATSHRRTLSTSGQITFQ